MRSATTTLWGCTLLAVLGCGGSGSNAPPSGGDDAGTANPPQVDGGTCGSDAGAPFSGTIQFGGDTCVEQLAAGTFPFKPACTLPHNPGFVAFGSPVGPATAPPTTTCFRPSKASALAQSAQTFCNRSVGTQLTFNVPPGTGSVTILSQARATQDAPLTITGSDGGTCFQVTNSVAPTSVTDANARVLLDSAYSSGDPVDAGIYYGSLSESTGAMTFPDSAFLLDEVNKNGGLPGGAWTFSVDDLANDCHFFSNCSGGSATGSYDVTVIAKPVAPVTGTVDVGFYLVETGGLTAASAVAAAQSSGTALGRMMKGLQTLYGNAGLCLGTVTFYDVPSWAQQRFSASIDADHTEPCSNLDQMFALLSQPGNALNFFLVSSISSSSQGGLTTVGLDGTIPGPSTAGGTIDSGAAVSIADLTLTGCTGSTDYRNCGADSVAYITAHEGGHWLGLYHTVESTGDTFDSLSDTATCPCSSCRPASASQQCGSDPMTSYQMSTLDCTASAACGSGDNLMFWLIGAASRGTVSQQQQQVMRGNPVVQ